MNIQQMMKQAQKMQKDMMISKDEISKTIFEGESSLVHIKMNGEREIISVKIDFNDIEKEDMEIIEDMVLIAVNDAIKKINKETEDKMGKFTQGMPGLF